MPSLICSLHFIDGKPQSSLPRDTATGHSCESVLSYISSSCPVISRDCVSIAHTVHAYVSSMAMRRIKALFSLIFNHDKKPLFVIILTFSLPKTDKARSMRCLTSLSVWVTILPRKQNSFAVSTSLPPRIISCSDEVMTLHLQRFRLIPYLQETWSPSVDRYSFSKMVDKIFVSSAYNLPWQISRTNWNDSIFTNQSVSFPLIMITHSTFAYRLPNQRYFLGVNSNGSPITL